MKTPVSGDLLSAVSLLATVISLLYSTWYSEIKDAQNVAIGLHDREPEIQKVQTALRSRASPLLAASVVLTVILVPTFIDVLNQNWNALSNRFDHWHYDPIQACFIAVVLVMILLVVMTASATYSLARTLKKLRTPTRPAANSGNHTGQRSG